ncbi:MAG: hypothetical protein SGJ10_04115 [Bacteroidota bacterium]|nr:hypothetical protein [Bacteroidota bacterium]
MTQTNSSINAALNGLFEGYASVKKLPNDYHILVDELQKSLALEMGFEDKVKKLDEIFSRHPQYIELQEAVFDLLMVHFLSVDANRFDPDYFESAEWIEIEENTLDRGTELLNLLLYIDECKHDEMEASLEDFLDEFLLTQEDGFSEEHEIYASLIELQEMVDEEVDDIIKAANSIEEEDPMHPYLLPILLFFKGDLDTTHIANKLPNKDALQMAYLCSLNQYQINL